MQLGHDNLAYRLDINFCVLFDLISVVYVVATGAIQIRLGLNRPLGLVSIAVFVSGSSNTNIIAPYALADLQAAKKAFHAGPNLIV